MKSVKMSLLRVSFLLLGAIGGHAEAAVWVESNHWNQQWEDRFSEWIKNSFNEDIFISGKYKDISTDCADAVYLSRAIFAFENKLPFVMLDPTGGEGKISNRMSRFDGGGELSRFRRFAEYIGDMGDTKTLPKDTYPIAVNREFVRSGAIWSRPRIAKSNFWSFLFGGTIKEDPGHAEVVKDVTETGAIELIGSTVPSAVRKLLTTSSLVFMPVETTTGLRKWMEPDWYGKTEQDLPGFSLEQFTMGETIYRSNNPEDIRRGRAIRKGPRELSGWAKEVQTRLQLREENKEETLVRTGTNLCNLVQARVDTILKAEKRRQELKGTCMNADDYDSYSTPSRDKRIVATIDELIKLGGGWGITTRGRLPKVKQYLEQCPPVKINPEHTATLFDIAMSYAKGDISSNPNDKLTARWGLEDDKAGKSCPTY